MKTEKGNIEKLLLETYESYYWIGFLLSDGHLSELNRIVFGLSDKDKDHLLKFIKYLNFSEKRLKLNNNFCYFSKMDQISIPKIKDKFDISHKKTIYPPKIKIFENMKEELLLCLFIGFIDGDGRIDFQSNRDDCFLTIKLHQSWLDILLFFNNLINKILNLKSPDPKINSLGYARLNFTNIKILRFLKNKTIEYNLPVLARKWDKIDVNKISRYEIAQDISEKVQKMDELGIKSKDIIEILNINKGRLFLARKKYKQKLLTNDGHE